MKKQYIVNLAESEREQLRCLLGEGEAAARMLTRVRILLKADQGAHGPGWADRAIAEALETGTATVERVRRRYVTEGLAAALHPRPACRQPARKLDGVGEAHLIALACSAPPDGRARWTLRLLADKLVEFQAVEAISHETVRRTLKQTR
jgi:transposase